jgi:hypothetical protein
MLSLQRREHRQAWVLLAPMLIAMFILTTQTGRAGVDRLEGDVGRGFTLQYRLKLLLQGV